MLQEREDSRPERKVGIITDWSRACRANVWSGLIDEINRIQANKFRYRLTDYPIAELLVDPQPKLAQIDEEDILILNWDVANGDPEFGGQLCQRWLDHRRPEIINWVRAGGILIIESQTVLGVPCQAAYDAIVGRAELPVSGLEDRSKPLQYRARCGTRCKKARGFPEFDSLDSVEEFNTLNYTKDVQQFPSHASRFLLKVVGSEPTSYLYRGWFRRVVPHTRHFEWSTLLTTHRRGLVQHATLKAARVGEGAIFASTMLVSLSNQRDLAYFMLSCHSSTGRLPLILGVSVRTKRIASVVVALSAAILGSLLVTWLGKETGAEEGPLRDYGKPIVTGIIVLSGVALIEGVRRLLLRCWRAIRYFWGY